MRTGLLAVLVPSILAVVVAAGGCAADRAPLTDPRVPSFSTARVPLAAGERTVPNTCGAVATQDEVSDILGSTVSGRIVPVIGVPSPAIGRTARLDCYYGVSEGQPVTAAPVWIGLAGYVDHAAAERRVTETVEDERDSGAVVSEIQLGTGRAIMLNGPKPMLVAARGRTTVVVTAVPVLLPEGEAGQLLGRLAEQALVPR